MSKLIKFTVAIPGIGNQTEAMTTAIESVIKIGIETAHASEGGTFNISDSGINDNEIIYVLEYNTALNKEQVSSLLKSMKLSVSEERILFGVNKQYSEVDPQMKMIILTSVKAYLRKTGDWLLSATLLQDY